MICYYGLAHSILTNMKSHQDTEEMKLLEGWGKTGLKGASLSLE